MSLVRRGGISGSSYFVVEGNTISIIFNGSILLTWTVTPPVGYILAETGDHLLQETGSKIYAE